MAQAFDNSVAGFTGEKFQVSNERHVRSSYPFSDEPWVSGSLIQGWSKMDAWEADKWQVAEDLRVRKELEAARDADIAAQRALEVAEAKRKAQLAAEEVE